MDALISSSDIKTFYSALQCLSRFSDTFWLQCTPRPNPNQAQIRLSAINPTNSAFCMFAFDPDFFLSLKTDGEKLECQIQIKPLLTILRSRGRTVERLRLALSSPASAAHRFTLKLHCHHAITKSHSFTFSPKRGLLPTADPNPPNYFCLHPSTAAEWTDHFLSSSRNGEITFVCSPTSCVARSKEDETPHYPTGSSSSSSKTSSAAGGLRKSIHTEVKLAIEDFKEYGVLEDVGLTFSLREFKATVALAESWGCSMEVNFSEGDEPLFVRLRVENAVVGEIVIATTRADRAGGHGQADGQGQGQQRAPGERAAQREREAVAVPARSTGASSSAAPSRAASTAAAPCPAMSRKAASTTASSHPPAPPWAPSEHSVQSRAAPIPNQSTPLPLPSAAAGPSRATDDEEDDETQPLFFPGGASQLSLNLTPHDRNNDEEQDERLLAPNEPFVDPTPVARGGDPDDFLTLQNPLPVGSSQWSSTQASTEAAIRISRSQSQEEQEQEQEQQTTRRDEGARKRFKPLF